MLGLPVCSIQDACAQVQNASNLYTKACESFERLPAAQVGIRVQGEVVPIEAPVIEGVCIHVRMIKRVAKYSTAWISFPKCSPSLIQLPLCLAHISLLGVTCTVRHQRNDECRRLDHWADLVN